MTTLTNIGATRKEVAPRITTSCEEGGAVVLRIETANAAPVDELVELGASGLESRAWKALVKKGELPARKLGRKWYTTRSALCRLVTEAPTKVAARTTKKASDLDELDAYIALVSKGAQR